MRYFAVTLLCLIGAVSCVLPGDLRTLADAQDQAIQEVKEEIKDFELEVLDIRTRPGLSETEVEELIAEAREARDDSFEEIASELGMTIDDLIEAVKNRTENVVSPIPITGNPLIDMLIALGLTGFGSFAATNKVRDSRRVVRGEPVQPTPVTGSAT